MTNDQPARREQARWKVGTVPYLVARPLTWGLEKHAQVELVEAPPARLAQMLREGSLDMALASSVLALEEPPLAMWEEGPVIASAGPIRSVLLFLRPGLENPRQLQSWAADPHSRTGQRLTRWLLQHTWDLPHAEAVDLEDGVDPFSLPVDAVQLIGDPALDAVHRHPDWKVVDLGSSWKKATDLPFVFAGWMAKPGFERKGLEAILQQAAAAGLPRRAELAVDAASGQVEQEVFLKRYLCDDLLYRLPAVQIQACLAKLGCARKHA